MSGALMVDFHQAKRRSELWLLRNYASGALREELDDLFKAPIHQGFYEGTSEFPDLSTSSLAGTDVAGSVLVRTSKPR
jgi:hypothetical protein